jgi:hypothetical protein
MNTEILSRLRTKAKCSALITTPVDTSFITTLPGSEEERLYYTAWYLECVKMFRKLREKNNNKTQ